MRGINKVILVCTLGKAPDVRYSGKGTAFANVSAATNESWTDKQTGQKKERTEWHNLVFADRLAEIAGEYLKKGSPIYIEGKLVTRKWQDGNGQDRDTTEIRVKEMQMLGGKPQGGQTQHGASQGASQAGGAGSNFDDFDDDIPF